VSVVGLLRAENEVTAVVAEPEIMRLAKELEGNRRTTPTKIRSTLVTTNLRK
jgi:hypothetical protein